MQRKQMELIDEQLKAARSPVELPELDLPKALPPPPPPMAGNAESAYKAEEQRRRAGRRTNAGRGTIFAGETGRSLGGKKSILG